MTARPGMPVVELHGYTPDGVKAKHYGSSDLDAAIDVTPLVSRVAWTHSVSAPWETISLRLHVPVRMWRDVLPGPITPDGGRTPQTGFWVVVRESATGTALAWGRCTRMSTGREVLQSGADVAIPVEIECSSWLSLLERSRVMLFGAQSVVEAPGFLYRLNTWGPQIAALGQAVTARLPGTTFERMWAANGGESGIVTLTLPTSLVAGEDGKPLYLSDQVPLVYTTKLCRRFAPQRLPAHKAVAGLGVKMVASILPDATLWDWFSSTFAADPAMIELFPTLEYPDKNTKPGQPSGKLLFGAGQLATSEAQLQQGKVEELTIDNDEVEASDPGSTAPQITAISKALGGAQPCLVYRMRPFLRYPITQEAAEEGFSETTTRPGKPASEQLGAFQQPIDTAPAYGDAWYTFYPDEVTRPQFTWSEDDRVSGVYVRVPFQGQSKISLFGLQGTPVIRYGELAQHGLRMYTVDWPFVPSTLLESASATQDSTLTSSIEAHIEAAWMMIGDGQRFARGTMTTRYKPWVKAGMWFQAYFDERPAGEDNIAQTLDAYIEAVRHEVSVDTATSTVRTSTEITFSRGSAAGYTPVPVRPHDFTLRPPPDVQFDRGVSTPTVTSTTDRLSQFLLWSDVDPHDQVRVPPSNPQYAQLRRVAANLQRVAANLDKLVVALRALGKSNSSLSTLAGCTISVTSHGGYHGGWEDKYWLRENGQPRRQMSSRHRRGEAIDFIIRGAAGEAISPNDIADVIQALVANGTMDSGYVATYTGDTFTHYDIRSAGTTKALAVAKSKGPGGVNFGLGADDYEDSSQ